MAALMNAPAKTPKPLAAKRYAWRKLSSAKWSDSWLERLSFLGPTRAMVIEFPGARTVRVEAHGLTEKEAQGLLKMFGGKISEAKWLAAVNSPMREPIRVRGRLLVVSTEAELAEHEKSGAKLPTLLIPAGMAFGTGEHATTATCLRLLADVSRELAGTPWELLDLGTGSGILALAGSRLGEGRRGRRFRSPRRPDREGKREGEQGEKCEGAPLRCAGVGSDADLGCGDRESFQRAVDRGGPQDRQGHRPRRPPRLFRGLARAGSRSDRGAGTRGARHRPGCAQGKVDRGAGAEARMTNDK